MDGGNADRQSAVEYTKMIHNGIEYGMMRALGEGVELLTSMGRSAWTSPLPSMDGRTER